jgi:hypothetical protein
MTVDRCQARQRRGASLVEMVLIVGTVAVILGLCGLFMHLMLKLDRASRGTVADAGTVGRLARQFRQDVRAAGAAKVVASGGADTGGIDLTGPGRPTVAYRGEGDRLIRTETDGGAVRRREGYALAHLASARFQADGPRVVLTLPRRADVAGPATRPGFRVEASLGKDRHLASREEATR